MTPEEREAAIIARVYAAPYAHAENILIRLRALEREMPHDEAVEVIYHEVIE